MRKNAALAALLAAIVFATLAFGPLPADDAPPIQVVRAYYHDPAQLRQLAGWLEPWETHRAQGFVVLEVSKQDAARLEALGFTVEVDDELSARLNRLLRPEARQAAGIPGYACFRTVDETLAAGQRLAAAYPGLAAWIDIGDSWEKTAPGGAPGSDLRVLRLTNAAVPGPKPRLFAMSGLHARELATAELLTRFAEGLLAGYAAHPEIAYLLDTHEIHLLLQSNPDGRRQAETGLYWRKNTDARFCSPSSVNRGVDLNRNFAYMWNCCGGSSGNPCSELYRGPSSASEPEVQAIQAYLRSQFVDARGPGLNDAAPDDTSGLFLDIHSYGRLVVWPWGFTDQPPANATAMRTLGRKLAFFNRYEPYQAYGMYPIDGASDDFAYGELGLAAYTVELGDYFFESCATFENNILPANLNMLLYAARISAAPYRLPAGPDVLDLQAPALVSPPRSSITLSATLNDTRFYTAGSGSEPVQPLAAAEYALGAVPASGLPALLSGELAPGDGAWDEPVEQAFAEIDISGLEAGRYLLAVRARDAAGNWGPVSTRSILVGTPVFMPLAVR